MAWVPESVRQFQRPGVVYRALNPGRGRKAVPVPGLPSCETSLVWRGEDNNPSLARFVEFAAQARQAQ